MGSETSPSLRCKINLIIIAARVYKLRPAEVNFLSCYTPAEGIMISVRSLERSDGVVSDPIKLNN